MTRASSVHAETGMQLTRSTVLGLEVLAAGDDSGSTFWAIPGREMAIVNIAGPGGGPVADLPALLLAALPAN
jgi:hypothetical protein